MKFQRKSWVLIVSTCFLLVAYATWVAASPSTAAIIVLGLATVAVFSALVLEGPLAAGVVACIGVALSVAATAGLVWSYANWGQVEAANFQTSGAAIWYGSMYALLGLPVVAVVWAGARLAQQLLAARRRGT